MFAEGEADDRAARKAILLKLARRARNAWVMDAAKEDRQVKQDILRLYSTRSPVVPLPSSSSSSGAADADTTGAGIDLMSSLPRVAAPPPAIAQHESLRNSLQNVLDLMSQVTGDSEYVDVNVVDRLIDVHDIEIDDVDEEEEEEDDEEDEEEDDDDEEDDDEDEDEDEEDPAFAAVKHCAHQKQKVRKEKREKHLHTRQRSAPYCIALIPHSRSILTTPPFTSHTYARTTHNMDLPHTHTHTHKRH